MQEGSRSSIRAYQQKRIDWPIYFSIIIINIITLQITNIDTRIQVFQQKYPSKITVVEIIEG